MGLPEGEDLKRSENSKKVKLVSQQSTLSLFEILQRLKLRLN